MDCLRLRMFPMPNRWRYLAHLNLCVLSLAHYFRIHWRLSRDIYCMYIPRF